MEARGSLGQEFQNAQEIRNAQQEFGSMEFRSVSRPHSVSMPWLAGGTADVFGTFSFQHQDQDPKKEAFTAVIEAHPDDFTRKTILNLWPMGS